MAGPGTGIPNPYPLAINTPLDRAYLRPLQEPLYDSEILNFTTPQTSLTFYQRPISQTTADTNTATTKTESETNLNQSSMLDYPREFSILGFNIVLDQTIGLASATLIYRRAFFQFTFSGRRPYLQIPLHRIPQGVGLEGGISQTTTNATNAFGKMGIGHIANFYKFNLGRAALKIKPGEAFNGKITFPVAPTLATTANTNFAVTGASPAGWWINLMTVGLSWSPL